MSFPAWAMAPVIGEINPILIGAWASASPALSIRAKAIRTDRIELMVRIALFLLESFPPLAVFAGRVVAGVHGVLQILLRLVRPKLRDVWKGIDHRVLKLPTDPLNLSHVDILKRVSILIEANGATRSIS